MPFYDNSNTSWDRLNRRSSVVTSDGVEVSITNTTEESDNTNGISPTETDEEYVKLTSDINTHESEMRRLMRANGIYEPEDMKYWTTFYRYPRIDPFNHVQGAREYAFFTKPDLPILRYQTETGFDYNKSGWLSDAASQFPYFNWLYSHGYLYTVLENLCYGTSDGSSEKNCPFVRILSNRKTSNIDIPDLAVDELETAQNMFGSRILYPKSSISSDENVDFTIEFEDTRYLEIYNYFKTWDYARQLKWLGLLPPKKEYILNKILYDHISIFRFLVDDDGETILHFSKFTGVFPKTISRSSFSEIPQSGPLKVTIGFKLSGFFEDMEPNILSDFNTLVANWKDGTMTNPTYNEIPLWDDSIGAMSGESGDYPYIYYPKEPDWRGYKLPMLKWSTNTGNDPAVSWANQDTNTKSVVETTTDEIQNVANTIGSYAGITFNKDMTPEELEKATEAKRMNKF